MDDHELAADIAREAGRAARATCSADGATQGRRRPPEQRPDPRRASPTRDPTTRCSRRSRRTIPSGSSASGSGSSTRSTARASSAKPAAPTGPCTSRSSSTASPTASRGRAARAGRHRALDRRRRRRSRRRSDRQAATARVAHPPAELAEYLAGVLDAELVPLGSAGAKTMAVVQGDADVYAHSGGQYEWDSAAPVGVADGRRLPLLAARRLAARLQPARPVPARPARVPPRARRPGARLRSAHATRLTQARALSLQRPGSHGVWRSLVSAQRSGR